MQFLMTTRGGDSAPPDDALLAEVAAFVDEMTRAGVLLATGGLGPGARVASRGGRVTVTDGPFAEAKESIVSFALIEAASMAEAVEHSRRFWALLGDGEGTIQPVFGPQG